MNMAFLIFVETIPSISNVVGKIMRHRNTAVLIGLLLILPALQSACTSKEEAAQRYLQEGKALLEQGKTDQARIQFKNAAQSNPKLADAYYNLALLDEKKLDWKGMYGNLLETVRLNPTHAEAHFKLGLAYLAGHQIDKASEEAILLEKLKPGSASALLLHGNVLFSRGKKSEGIEEIKQSLVKEPANYEAAAILSTLYLSQGNHAEALATLNRSIELHPKDIGLQRMKIQTEVDGKDYEAAIAGYRALIEQNPDKRELSYGLVQLLVKIGRQAQAEAFLHEIIDKYPTDTNAKLALVGFIAQHDPSEAEKSLAKFVAENPNNTSLLSQLAGLYAGQQRYADAQSVLERIVGIDKAGNAGMLAKLGLARVALAQKDDKVAAARIAEVIAADANNPDALLLRSLMRLQNKEIDAAIADLRIVLAANPKQDKALVLLARAYQQNGNSELADNNLRQALEINPGNLDAALPIAAKLLTGRELDRAEEVLNNALKTNPDDPTALQLLAQAHALKNDWVGAQALATKLGKQAKGSATGHYLSGEIFVAQKNYSEAVKQFQAALQEQPDFPDAIRALAQVYNAKGEHGQFKSYLLAFINKNPKIIPAYLALAFAHAADKEWSDADRVLRNALRIDPKSVPSYQTLAGIYQAQAKPAEEIEIYRKGLTELPDDVSLMVGLGQVYERVKDSEAAIGLYQQVLKKQPKLELAANNLASVLVDYRTDKESLQQAIRLVEPFATSSNPNLLDTYAWVQVRGGYANKAIPVLKRVIADNPNVAVFRYHLGTAYYQTLDLASAKTELNRALELAQKYGDFVGIDQVRNLLKEIGKPPGNAKAP